MNAYSGFVKTVTVGNQVKTNMLCAITLEQDGPAELMHNNAIPINANKNGQTLDKRLQY